VNAIENWPREIRFFIISFRKSSNTCHSFLTNINCHNNQQNANSVVSVRNRTTPTKRSVLVGEVSSNFADSGCYVVSVTDSYERILKFLGRSRYVSFQVAP
jgi:hypothetical protein